MSKGSRDDLPPAAERLLAMLAAPDRGERVRSAEIDADALACLVRADLLVAGEGLQIEVTSAGHAHLARQRILRSGMPVDPFLGQHLDLARRSVDTPHGRAEITVDDAESPLAWLARRKGRDGRPMLEPIQVQAGEKLRAQFTRANLTPKTTSNWSAPIVQSRRAGGGGGAAAVADVIVAARQQVHRALDAVGPEFAGLLVDVCCFLKGLEDVERERGWPSRSAKVVLQLGLDRLARHYGLGAEARGRSHAPIRAWLAPDAALVVDGT
jgi:Domain of unknown function (DUF6456)